MSKTVHPYSFRLGILRNWKSRWFSPIKYRHLLKADVLIREALIKSMRGMYVEGIEIERSPAVFHLIVKTSRPGLLIGRKGEGADKIKAQITGIMKKIKAEIPKEIKLTVEEIKYPESSAMILAQMAAENLEKRMPFRRTMKQIMEKAMASNGVKGIKVAMSGRLDGLGNGKKGMVEKRQNSFANLARRY